MFRSGFTTLLQKSQASGAVDVPAFSRLNRSLHNHHHTEDTMWFPGFRRQHPELKLFIDVLESDHAELVRLEQRVMQGDMHVSMQLSRSHATATA
jgi:hypothetical protein